MKKIVIAIDGYSGCGKSSTAKEVARQLGYSYIDTGAMYRAVTLFFLNNNIDISNSENIENALSNIELSFGVDKASGTSMIYLNGECVEEEIRKMYVSEKVSKVSAIKRVREDMVSQQRKMGKEKGVVMDGRDIGTVVFPDAELKVFMTADVMTRALRRQKELKEKSQEIKIDDIVNNLEKRDHLDANREESPLKKANDAVLLDTTEKTFREQVDEVVHLAKLRMS